MPRKLPNRMVIDEGWVKKQVKKILAKYKPDLWYYMPPASQFGRRGVPDFVICFKGWFITIETKANGNTPTDTQLDIHKLIHKAQGVVWVIDENNLDWLEQALAAI